MEQPIPNLQHESWSVRAKAIRELGDLRVQDPQAVESLVRALREDAVAAVRQQAAHALGKIRSPDTLDPLVAALSDPDCAVRNNAISALAELNDSRAVEPLIDALGDLDWRARHKAATALGQLGDPRAVQPLIAALADKNDAVRDHAGEALTHITGKRFLLGAKNPARWRRWWASHQVDLPQREEPRT